MKPGWLVRIGFAGSLIAQIALRLVRHTRGLGLAMVILLVVIGPLLVYALFAPAEKKLAGR